MAVTEMAPETESATDAAAPRVTGPGVLERLLGTGDHTSIGRLFIGFSLLLVAVSLVVWALTGVDEVAANDVLGTRAQMLNTSSLVALVFLGVVPLMLGVAIHMVPLQVGSPAVAFPRAAALSLWSWVVFAVIFIVSVAADGGIGGGNADAAGLGNVALAAMMVALGLGAVCVATTVVTLRPAGMGLARVPLFAWSMLVTAAVWITTFGAAVAHSIIGHVGTRSSDTLLENFSSGLAWLFRGPAIFMLAIPVLGIAADVLGVATGRALRNYGVFQGAIAAYGIASFGAWAQTDESINTALWALFAFGVALAVIVVLGGLVESIRHGSLVLGAALLGSLLALFNLLAAAAVGVLMAFDTAGHNTLLNFLPTRLAEAQAVFVITAAIVGALSALAHWSSKIWGPSNRDSKFKTSILAVDVGGVVLALTLAAQVMVQNGGSTSGEKAFGVLAALGALVVLGGVLMALSACAGAARGSADARSPSGFTLEWQTPSPAVGGVRTAEMPVVASPYPLMQASPAETEEVDR